MQSTDAVMGRRIANMTANLIRVVLFKLNIKSRPFCLLFILFVLDLLSIGVTLTDIYLVVYLYFIVTFPVDLSIESVTFPFTFACATVEPFIDPTPFIALFTLITVELFL